MTAKKTSPSTAPTVRDLGRTRDKILAAALAEYAAKGPAGARIQSIARRARVNKRMLYYCFGNKAELYREVLRSRLAERSRKLDAMPASLPEGLLYMQREFCADSQWLRLLQWEALADDGSKPVAWTERRRLVMQALGHLQRSQDNGLLPPDTDLKQLFLAIFAVVIFPLAFPQMCRMATGLQPTDPKFRVAEANFLRWLGERLAGSSAQSPWTAAVGESNLAPKPAEPRS